MRSYFTITAALACSDSPDARGRERSGPVEQLARSLTGPT
jgi:hypothetical protein